MPGKGKTKLPGKPKSERPTTVFYDGPEADQPKNRRSSSTFYVPAPHLNGTVADGAAHVGSTAADAGAEPRDFAAAEGSHLAEPRSGASATAVRSSEAVDEWRRRTSALNMTLSQILLEQDVQHYFAQFMHSCGAEHLVKFWLSANDFAKAAGLIVSVSCTTLTDCSVPVASGAAVEHPPGSGVEAPHQACTNEAIQQDAIAIYSRYISLDCTHPIGITESIRNLTTSKMCPEDGAIEPSCFSDCVVFVESIMEKRYLNEFLKSSYFRRYHIDLLTSDRLHLLDVLYNTKALDYFREFMEQENALNYLQFWLAVDNFEEQLLLGNHSNAIEDAMVLYNRYFSLQATEPLGFEDKVRNLVELNICCKEGPHADCFVLPKIAVLKFINATYFSSFRRSHIFYHKYLAELIRDLPEEPISPMHVTLQLHQPHGLSANPETVSIASSDNPDTSRKTAEVAEDPPLWSRDYAGKMALGYVNDYGVFVSYLNKLPEAKSRKQGSLPRLSRKKKEKEEMASMIAQRIITEVLRDVNDCSAANQSTNL